ncbi:MAG TPA: T9SS type A sorting domain-containing protein [Yeosuana sp.]
MKKITLLLLLSIFFSFSIYAQVLQSENFDGLTIGDVNADLTGATPGQGGWYTFNNSIPPLSSDFQIINEGGSQAQVLQITGPANDSDVRALWQNGLDTDWATRTSGNDIIEIEYDLFTGPSTISLGESDVFLFNGNNDLIAGFSFNYNTKEIAGLARYDNAGNVGVFLFTLGTAPIILSPNTWHRVGFSFNKTTGVVIWKGPGFYGGITGAAAGTDPLEVDFVLYTSEGNTTSAVVKFDRFTTRATAIENLLDTNVIQSRLANIKLYPNPAKDIVNIDTNLKIDDIAIFNQLGQTVMQVKGAQIFNNKVDISGLSSGLYFMNIKAADKVQSIKIIKE